MVYLFGSYKLDTSLPLLLRDGETVPVPSRGLLALALLIQRRHTAVTKTEMMEALWPDSFVEEGSLAQLISVLRKALAPGFPDGSPIQTISKVGYRFVTDVVESNGAAAVSAVLVPADIDGVPASPPDAREEGIPIPPQAPAAEGGRRWVWLTGGAGLLAAVALSVFAASVYRQHRHISGGRNSVGPYTAAVLPFRSLNGAPDSVWIGTAIQEMLSTDLRLSQGLRVLPAEDTNRALREVHAGSASQGNGSSLDADPGKETLRQLGEDLGCQHAVLGAYLVQGDRIRLDTRVVNLQTGATEEESSLEQPEASLLPMIAKVSAQTVHDLGFSQEGEPGIAALAAGLNPAAYKLFTEGVTKNRAYDGKGAADLLQHSISIDPNFPLAHLELSLAYTARGDEKLATAEADRALQLSKQLPREQQLAILARAQSARHQFASAAETYRALFRFYPDNLQYGGLLIQSLSSAGQTDQALAETQGLLASARQEPPSPQLYSVIADLYSTRGDWARSLQWAQRGAEESRRRGATILYERLLTTESQAELHMGQYATAEAQTQQALTLARQFADVSGELRALNRLGEIAVAQNDWGAAETALRPALEIERRYDQRQRQAHTLLALSKVSQSKHDLKTAYAYSRAATDLAEELGFADVVTEARLQTAVVQAGMGERNKALVALAGVQHEAGTIHDAFLQQQAHQAIDKISSVR